jgi:sulfur carrier protein|tara:strand:+ start:12213 stop:12413 length:201 start_codon:yes stop_codon:yes gene_type:complete
MEVKFNGEQLSIQVSTLGELLQEKGLMEKTGIAVAINSAVVSKSKWNVTSLHENDEILIITAAAGG